MDHHFSYELHGRLVAGSLECPHRNESRHLRTEDLAEARERARAWSGQGFTVWIYDHGHPSPFPQASDLRVIAVVAPGPHVTPSIG